jgi:uncharacterized protein YyaL (SSP411 family)
MERESFEDGEVARILNEGFVSVKVDREEHPDIDQIYMAVCQLMGGSCGWPLTVLMTPDARPFFVATYIPRTSRFGRIGMLDLLPRVLSAWADDRERVEASARQVTEAVRGLDSAITGSDRPDPNWLRAAFTQFADRFDREYGGFGAAPKFPAPHNLMFLLRYWYRQRDPVALKMVVRTLHAMRVGGIFDQVGFGFHRYSTDREWKLPHFEKMMYDQALHVMAYTEAYLATGETLFADTAREVAEYVLRDLTSDEGCFYSAEDADSGGVEGKFYVWTLDEVRDTLPSHLADVVVRTYGITEEGNFLDEATQRLTGENVLHRSPAARDASTELEMLEQARLKLFEARRVRVRPLLDDKVLTDWNGLMIAALSKLGMALGNDRYIRAARRCAEFLLSSVLGSGGALMHRYRNGEVGVDGNLPDYAYLIWGLTELYQASLEPHFLTAAREITDGMIGQFWDDEEGGFFMTPVAGEPLIARLKDYDDGALPSGNALALLGLLRLSRLTGDATLDELASRLLASVAPRVSRYPSGYTGILVGMEFVECGPTEVVLSGPSDSDVGRGMLESLRSRYLPGTVVLRLSEAATELEAVAPFVGGFKMESGDTLAYVCRDHACSQPARSTDAMLRELGVDDDDRAGRQQAADEPA